MSPTPTKSSGNAASSDNFTIVTKRTKRTPSPTDNTPTAPASRGTASVYYHSTGETVFLGTANDLVKLAHFSERANGLLNYHYPSHELSKVTDNCKIIIDCVDHTAGQTVLAWINGNSVSNPKHVSMSLLGSNPQFEDGCKLHQATKAFRVPRHLRGEEIRGHLYSYIHGLKHVSFADFKLTLDLLSFDPGLCNDLKRKVCYQTLKDMISEDVLGLMMAYVTSLDLAKGPACTELRDQMRDLENKVQAGIEAASAQHAKRLAAKTVEESDEEDDEPQVVTVIPSAAQGAQILERAPKVHRAPAPAVIATPALISPSSGGIDWAEELTTKEKAVKTEDKKRPNNLGGKYSGAFAELDAHQKRKESEAAAEKERKAKGETWGNEDGKDHAKESSKVDVDNKEKAVEAKASYASMMR